MIEFLQKAFFLLTKVRIDTDSLTHLVNLNVVVQLYEVDRLNCKDGVVHFIPLRCVHHSHDEILGIEGVKSDPPNLES